MSSAARSSSATTARDGDALSGPVAVCVDRPLLSLDRPFTYDLPPELEAGVGSLVRVRFHGKLIRGWVLGPTDDVPPRRLSVHARVSPVRFFDEPMLDLFRWMSERYVAPLASVIARSHPPRVSSEEVAPGGGGAGLRGTRSAPSAPFGRRRGPAPAGPATSHDRGPADPSARDGGGRAEVAAAGGLLPRGYANGPRVLEAVRGGSGAFVIRTGAGEDARVALECVASALAGGRTAIVLVPEVEPVPETVRAIVEAFGDDVACFFGGDRRSRYRTWLAIASGAYRVVVGTRPAVFAPLRRLGLVFVAREHHALHREERSPYYHVRDVARARAALVGATCVLASVMPSLEALATTHVDVEPSTRRWPRVEAVRPGPEGRAPRLVAALRAARRAFLYEPIRGSGVARVCRSCGEAAACASCGGMLRAEEGQIRCAVCEAPGRCANCGASDFAIAPGGVERVERWARRLSPVAVSRLPAGRARAPAHGEVLVGGIEAVKDVGPLDLDLVGILDADASLRRPGISARERALSTWAEVAAWAGPGGRVIVQTTHPNDHAVQALVAGRPARFARTESVTLADAGFPVGAPVFRVVGTEPVADELGALPHRTLLATGHGEQTVCLVALDRGDLAAFGAAVRALAERGVVTRVEAEPHL